MKTQMQLAFTKMLRRMIFGTKKNSGDYEQITVRYFPGGIIIGVFSKKSFRAGIIFSVKTFKRGKAVILILVFKKKVVRYIKENFIRRIIRSRCKFEQIIEIYFFRVKGNLKRGVFPFNICRLLYTFLTGRDYQILTGVWIGKSRIHLVSNPVEKEY
jgi:hypothetical protein